RQDLTCPTVGADLASARTRFSITRARSHHNLLKSLTFCMGTAVARIQGTARRLTRVTERGAEMSQLLISLLAAAGIAFAGAANAANTSGMSRDVYKADKDKIEAQYKADKGQCASMSGNAKDIC